MVLVYTRRTESEGACHRRTLYVALYLFKDFFVSVTFIASHIYGEDALVGHNVVLSSSVDDCDAHLHRAEQVCLFRELMYTDPAYVVQRLVYGVFSYEGISW